MSCNFAVEVLEHNIVVVVLVVYMYALNFKQGKHKISTYFVVVVVITGIPCKGSQHWH